MKVLTDRFWSKVEKTETCWLWTASRTSAGYGNFRIGPGNDYAHRLAYVDRHGPIPEGCVLDHLCRVRHCCNPDHLEAVPQRVNVQRGLGPYGLRTECRHGHDITVERNVYVDPTGGRRCRECARIREESRRDPSWPPTHCPQGHEYTEANTYLNALAHRKCRTCNRERSRRNYYARKAAS